MAQNGQEGMTSQAALEAEVEERANESGPWLARLHVAGVKGLGIRLTSDDVGELLGMCSMKRRAAEAHHAGGKVSLTRKEVARIAALPEDEREAALRAL